MIRPRKSCGTVPFKKVSFHLFFTNVKMFFCVLVRTRECCHKESSGAPHLEDEEDEEEEETGMIAAPKRRMRR